MIKEPLKVKVRKKITPNEKKQSTNENMYKQYLELKNKAYDIVPYFNSLSMKDKYEFIENITDYLKGSEEYAIFLNTLLIPNDVKFIEDYKSIKNANALARIYRIPPKFILRKIWEINKYKLSFLINEGLIDYNLASQDYDWTKPKKHDIDEAVKMVSFDQPIMTWELVDELVHLNKIEFMLKQK